MKVIAHVDVGPRICKLLRWRLKDVTLKGAWTAPAALELAHLALAPVAQPPVLEVISGTHLVTDMTLGMGSLTRGDLA